MFRVDTGKRMLPVRHQAPALPRLAFSNPTLFLPRIYVRQVKQSGFTVGFVLISSDLF